MLNYGIAQNKNNDKNVESIFRFSNSTNDIKKSSNKGDSTLLAEPFFCLLDFGVLEKGSA